MTLAVAAVVAVVWSGGPWAGTMAARIRPGGTTEEEEKEEEAAPSGQEVQEVQGIPNPAAGGAGRGLFGSPPKQRPPPTISGACMRR